jgi:chromosome segregation ATPase
MATLDERVAYLEGQVNEQSHAQFEIRDAIRSLEHRVDVRLESVDRRFEAVDRRFEAIDRRFDAVDRRFEAVDRSLSALDDKLSRQFMWLVGIQVTTLAAIVGALLARP